MLIDTSAIYSALDANSPDHALARQTFEGLQPDDLVTHNYVVLETVALVQHRLGTAATRTLADAVLPSIAVLYVDEGVHAAAMAALLARAGKRTSLVDLVSFEIMRRHGIRTAFAFDDDFRRAGFALVPSP